MERFVGIKKTYQKLPDVALYRIYELYKLNCKAIDTPAVKRIKKFKALIPGLETAVLTRTFSGPQNHFRIELDDDFKEPMKFNMEMDAAGEVEKFSVNWYRIYRPRYDEKEYMWMSVRFDVKRNTVYLNCSVDLNRRMTIMKKVWKLVLSTTIVLLDRFFQHINPQTIMLRVLICKGTRSGQSYGEEEIAYMRLVDAVRAAAKGKMVMV